MAFHGKKQVLLLDMYGVIIKESKGNFIPYTFGHFDETEHDRLVKAFREEDFFTRAGIGEFGSDTFLSLLGYRSPDTAMRDYLENYLTLDEDFLPFAEQYHKKFDFVLLSNDVKEWSEYLFQRYGLARYFKDSIVSGAVHMRKPERRIFDYAMERVGCLPMECIFVDNSVQNLETAKMAGIKPVLFNRDREVYFGDVVNDFKELGRFLDNAYENYETEETS